MHSDSNSSKEINGEFVKELFDSTLFRSCYSQAFSATDNAFSSTKNRVEFLVSLKSASSWPKWPRDQHRDSVQDLKLNKKDLQKNRNSTKTDVRSTLELSSIKEVTPKSSLSIAIYREFDYFLNKVVNCSPDLPLIDNILLLLAFCLPAVFTSDSVCEPDLCHNLAVQKEKTLLLFYKTLKRHSEIYISVVSRLLQDFPEFLSLNHVLSAGLQMDSSTLLSALSQQLCSKNLKLIQMTFECEPHQIAADFYGLAQFLPELMDLVQAEECTDCDAVVSIFKATLNFVQFQCSSDAVEDFLLSFCQDAIINFQLVKVYSSPACQIEIFGVFFDVLSKLNPEIAFKTITDSVAEEKYSLLDASTFAAVSQNCARCSFSIDFLNESISEQIELILTRFKEAVDVASMQACFLSNFLSAFSQEVFNRHEAELLFKKITQNLFMIENSFLAENLVNLLLAICKNSEISPIFLEEHLFSSFFNPDKMSLVPSKTFSALQKSISQSPAVLKNVILFYFQLIQQTITGALPNIAQCRKALLPITNLFCLVLGPDVNSKSFEKIETNEFSKIWFVALNICFDKFELHADFVCFMAKLACISPPSIASTNISLFSQQTLKEKFEKFYDLKGLNLFLSKRCSQTFSSSAKDIDLAYCCLIASYCQESKLQQNDWLSFQNYLSCPFRSPFLSAALITSFARAFDLPHYCDESVEIIDLFVCLIKFATSRFEFEADLAFAVLDRVLLEKRACCVAQNKEFLLFFMTVLGKTEESSRTNWNETFDPFVNTTFSIDIIDNLQYRAKLFGNLKQLFLKFLNMQTSYFGIISQIYTILKGYDETVSPFVKKLVFDYVLAIQYKDRLFRDAYDDISFVIKALSASDKKIQSSNNDNQTANFGKESLLNCLVAGLHSSSVDFSVIVGFLNSSHFLESSDSTVWITQILSYLLSMRPEMFEWLIECVLNAFVMMRDGNRGLFEVAGGGYLFNERIPPGPSDVNVFKKSFSSKSLPVIVFFDFLESNIVRNRNKSRKIAALSLKLCEFFLHSAEKLCKSPSLRAALLRIGSFVYELNRTFRLSLVESIEHMIASFFDSEVVDFRFTDVKSWRAEKPYYLKMIQHIEDDFSSNIVRQLLIFFARHEVYRQSLWHFGSGPEVGTFEYTWDEKSSQKLTDLCFSKFAMPRLALSFVKRICCCASKVSFYEDIRMGLVMQANRFPISIRYPKLLLQMISSKLMSESLMRIAPDWGTLSPIELVNLICHADPLVSEYAIDRLKNHYSPESIFFYIPELVQMLRLDMSGRTRNLILDLAKNSQLFTHLILWNMKANLATDDAGEKPDTVLAPILNGIAAEIDAGMNTEDRKYYEKEFSFFEKITRISGLLKPFVKCTKAEKKTKIDEELAKIPVEDGVYLPSNPESTVLAIDYTSGKPLQSAAKAPFMATFLIKQKDIIEPFYQSAIFKVGDDCRQDVLALQMINMFKVIFDSVGLPLYLYPYRVVATAPGCGVIEVLPNSISRDIMGREHINDLYEYYLESFGSEETLAFQNARQRFICSLAAYSVVSYLLSFKDRHNGNVMFDAQGHIIHIDFGFILGICPGGINFEGDGFKLTSEMAQLLGASDKSEHFKRFEQLVVNGFMAVRPWMNEFLSLVELMSRSGLPCFKGEETLERFKRKFRPDLSDVDARKYMLTIISSSYEGLGVIRAKIYDVYQYKTNKIPFKN